MTQFELAKRMGSTQSIVARWETGAHEITMTTLSRIAEALDVDLAVHFGRQESSHD